MTLWLRAVAVPVEAVLLPLVMSLAVTVVLLAVFSVTLNILVPAIRTALAGNAAFASLEVMPALSVIVLTRFHWLSTALTVTLKAVPAVWDEGAPLLPEALPGAAVSPGMSKSNFVNAP